MISFAPTKGGIWLLKPLKRARETTKSANFNITKHRQFILVVQQLGVGPHGIMQRGLCLDPTRFNEVLIRPDNRGPILNYILPRLACIKYLRLRDVSSGYNNLKLDHI